MSEPHVREDAEPRQGRGDDADASKRPVPKAPLDTGGVPQPSQEEIDAFDNRPWHPVGE